MIRYQARPAGGGVMGPGKFTPGEPSMPRHLGRAARVVWRRTVQEMSTAGVLSVADRDIIAAYSVAVADLEALSAQIDKDGLIIDAPVFDRDGAQVGTKKAAHPGLRWRQDLIAKLKQLAGELGLTPATRGRVSTPTPAVREPDALDLLDAEANRIRWEFTDGKPAAG
jgi:P27 family predicted phage terminase small subunit